MKIRLMRIMLVVAIFAGVARWASATPGQTLNYLNYATAAASLSHGSLEILKLTQAKVEEDTIIAYIKYAGINYRLSADQIIYLRRQGVSSTLIKAMLACTNAPPAVRVASPAPAPAPIVSAPTTAPTYNQAVNQPDAGAEAPSPEYYPPAGYSYPAYSTYDTGSYWNGGGYGRINRGRDYVYGGNGKNPDRRVNPTPPANRNLQGNAGNLNNAPGSLQNTIGVLGATPAAFWGNLGAPGASPNTIRKNIGNLGELSPPMRNNVRVQPVYSNPVRVNGGTPRNYPVIKGNTSVTSGGIGGDLGKRR